MRRRLLETGPRRPLLPDAEESPSILKEAGQNRYARQPAGFFFREEGDPWEAERGNLPYGEPRRRQRRNPPGPERSAGFPWTFLVFLFLVLFAAMAYGAWTFHRPYASWRAKAERMARQTFYEGVHIDGIPVGGLTPLEAAGLLQSGHSANLKPLALTVRVDQTDYLLTGAQIPITRNLEAVLKEAYALGRQGFAWMPGSERTPFETRFLQTAQLRNTGAYYATELSYPKTAVRALVQEIVFHANREPVNAVLASFDFNTRTFTVTQDQTGAWLDAEEVYRQLILALDRGDYTATLSFATVPVLPRVTAVELKNRFAMLSSFKTETTADEKRNTNVRLAAQAVNGTTVMPGETFSFNGQVGERTAQKGYQMAPAIAGGLLTDEIGGGVCQVSSTLFNAAAMAGMTVVSRSPHAWPSNYVEMGRDATVNWPGLDFKFRNDRDTPVFLVASYAGRTLTVEVYGMSGGSGEAIALDTVLVSSTPPPQEPILQQNPLLEPGTRQEMKKARTGYVVDTYRVYYRNGTEVRREKLFTSRYPAVQQVIEYN